MKVADGITERILLEICSKLEKKSRYIWIEEDYFFVFPHERGMVFLSRYKHRQHLDMAFLYEDNQAKPVTRQIASEMLDTILVEEAEELLRAKQKYGR